MPPVPFEAVSEEEASRTAITLENALCPEFAPELLVQVIAEYEPGRPIAEIRRPISR
jgi:hypothetical protein